MNFKVTPSYKAITALMKKRRLILDGSIDTQIQKFKLKKCCYGNSFSRENIDVLNFTQPKVIERIHNDYLNSGADVLTTNTFNSNSISQLGYGSSYDCNDLNKRAALIAKRTALKYSFYNKRRVFIAGSIGPTNETLSYVLEAVRKDVMFDRLSASYASQVNALLNSKVDVLLLKTVSDTLNAKAAILAYLKANNLRKRLYPFVISIMINNISGTTLSGQTLGGFWHSVSHSNPLGIGLHCSLGTWNFEKYVMELFQIIDKPMWIYLDSKSFNGKEEYMLNRSNFISKVAPLVDMASALGGGFGSVPDHIAKLKLLVDINKAKCDINQHIDQDVLWLSGLEAVKVNKNSLCKISGTTSVISSLEFRNMIISGNYKEVLNIIKQQVVNGAQIININMDDALIDSEHEVLKIMRLISLDPDLAKLPIMIDSFNWKILLGVMKCIQGKCIVGTISLKDGDKSFIERARIIRMYGCIPVITAFDESGPAMIIEYRLRICKRASILLIKYVGFNCGELIFDLNTFTMFISTSEHDTTAFELLRSIKLISCLFPQFNFISRLFNLSFLFKDNMKICKSLHCVFLKYAVDSGLNLVIMDVQNQISYSMLNNKVKQVCNALMSSINHITIEDFLKAFDSSLNDLSIMLSGDEYSNNWREWNVLHRIMYFIIVGIDKYIKCDSIELVNTVGSGQVIIDLLIEYANNVKELISSGEIPLSQIIKIVRVMEKLTLTVMSLIKIKSTVNKGVVILATPRVNVFDVEKYIIGVLLSCNSYKVIDLGSISSAYDIVQFAIKYKADVISISGLALSSLDEVSQMITLLNKNLMSIPLLIGGSLISKLCTVVKVCPEYIKGTVFYVSNVSEVVDIVSELSKGFNAEFIKTSKAEYKLIVEKFKVKQNVLPYKIALQRKPKRCPCISSKVSFIGDRTTDITDLSRFSLDVKFPDNVLAARTFALERKMFKIMSLEKWINIKRNIALFRAISKNNTIVLLNSQGCPLAIIPVLRQQNDSDTCFSLTDFIDPVSDYMGVCCNVIGIESVIIQQYFVDKGKFHCAVVFKSICDDLIEASSKHAYDDVRFNYWGYLKKSSGNSVKSEDVGIRFAFDDSSCSNYNARVVLSKLISLNTKLGLLISRGPLPFQQISALFLIISNPCSVYFDINNIGKDQVIEYAKISKFSVKRIEKLFSLIINYIPDL